ncbi:MAG: hypothetical protein HC824_17565 [Synechococcales cyanobacterium RM1_1_8]|nr:hypothetical protein [Synechococcales cyanobacterium RM1_1_8]
MIDKELQELIQALSLEDKQLLQGWLSKEIERELMAATIEPVTQSSRELVDRQRIGNLIYQLEMVKCGKPNCKCTRGQLHGPYWYAYQRQGDKFKSRYIGKTLKLPQEKEI